MINVIPMGSRNKNISLVQELIGSSSSSALIRDSEFGPQGHFPLNPPLKFTVVYVKRAHHQPL